jgi:hypothetical protein
MGYKSKEYRKYSILYIIILRKQPTILKTSGACSLASVEVIWPVIVPCNFHGPVLSVEATRERPSQN